MPDSAFHSSEQILRYIEASGESDNIDAKGPITWDSGTASAGLAKDIVSFANSRDGGVLVIGKSEVGSGQFDFVGLTDDQAESFETTKVANWINSRFAPPVRLVCHRQEHDGKTFVVITVAEFEDIPVLCTKSYQDPASGKHLIREKNIYVRNSNAESAPVGSVDELRNLIGLATTKRADQMLEMFNAMLKGQPLVSIPSEDEKFEAELEEVLTALDADSNGAFDAGSWQLIFHPNTYQLNRWSEIEDLEALIRKHTLRIRKEFPGIYRGTHPREWGISNDIYGGQWALTHSGLFVYRRFFWENHQNYKSPWIPSDGEVAPEIPAGKWIDFKMNVFLVIEFFMFMSRMAAEYDSQDSIHYRVSASPIAGRVLVSSDPMVEVGFGEPEPCRAQRFDRPKSVPVGKFRAEWEDECVWAMKQFFERFPGCRIQPETLRQWVNVFKLRRF